MPKITIDDYRASVEAALANDTYAVAQSLGEVYHKSEAGVTLALLSNTVAPAAVYRQIDVDWEMHIYLPMMASLSSVCNILAYLYDWCAYQQDHPVNPPEISYVGIDRQNAAIEYVMAWTQRLDSEPCVEPPVPVLIQTVNIEYRDDSGTLYIPIENPDGTD